LAKRFRTVRVEPDPIFVCDGRVWTSAGVTAGIDLALALVEEDLGPSVALAVARHLVLQTSKGRAEQHRDEMKRRIRRLGDLIAG
jgi:transcriptional regulator GlxA family with amidase domain